MKQKISITIDEEIVQQIEQLLEGTRFRNKSHIIEHAVDKFLRKE
ncbi:ribbon-helix-helix domain-containing protein [Nanoarchaeota archaeon]